MEIPLEEYLELFGEDSDGEGFDGFANGDLPRMPRNVEGESSESEDEDSEEDGEVPVGFEWNKQTNRVTVPPFQEAVGPRMQPEEKNPLGYFDLLFNAELCEKIALETNLYAKQFNDGKEIKDKDWFNSDGTTNDTSAEEIKALIGVYIMMGIVKLPSYRMYWKESDPFLYQPAIARVFTRRRFELLMRYLHINDKTKIPPRADANHKLYLIQPVIDAMKKSFFDTYSPGRELSIDEAMVKFKGRLSFIQYMPMKPIKRGIKVFCICDAASAFMLGFLIYVGKDTTVHLAQGLSVTDAIVDALVHPFEGKNHHLFMDNWFTSVNLFDQLEQSGFRACGTLRKNRKFFPAALKNVNLRNQGDSDFARSDNKVVTVWKDKAKKKPVTVLSSMCNPDEYDTVTRRKKDGTVFEISRPANVALYNKHMGGVDLNDQHRSYYKTGAHRSVKWWKYLFFFFLDVSIINAWTLYKLSGNTVLKTHLEFRLQLAKELIGNFTSRKRIGRPRVQPIIAVLDHVIDRMEEGGKPKECRYCQLKKKQLKAANKTAPRPRESKFGCMFCGVHLCVAPCFKLYHEQPAEDL